MTTHSPLDPREGAERSGQGPVPPDPAAANAPTPTAPGLDAPAEAFALDDTDPAPATSGQVDPGTALSGDPFDPAQSVTGVPPSAFGGSGHEVPRSTPPSPSGGQQSADDGSVTSQAREAKDAAKSAAADVREVAVDRGSDVADVAKEEFGQLAEDARGQLRTLVSQASDQVREQADNGRHQVADLLHSLASELGEMASRPQQEGPLTALAKQAANRTGQISHWLQEASTDDVLAEVRRFARRRPAAFLIGAALAGVVAGRLTRSLIAADDAPTARPQPALGSSAGREPQWQPVASAPSESFTGSGNE